MKQVQQVSFELTPISVKDRETQYVSMFFAQFPEAISQGKTEEEAFKNLVELLPFVLNDKKEEIIDKYNKQNIDYTSKSLNMVSA